MEASAEGGGVPWAKEGMFQTGEWIPFLGPEDMPSLCAVDKAVFFVRHGNHAESRQTLL